jgi:hypothetical protein
MGDVPGAAVGVGEAVAVAATVGVEVGSAGLVGDGMVEGATVTAAGATSGGASVCGAAQAEAMINTAPGMRKSDKRM